MIVYTLVIQIILHWLSLAKCIPLANIKEQKFLDDIKNSYRLPGDIVPLSYNITLQPYLLESDKEKRFTFDGEVYIYFRVKNNLKLILIHMKSLNITTSKLLAKPNLILEELDQSEKPITKSDIVTYTLKNELIANKIYILHFIYNGTLSDDMQGFYRSSYTNNNNVTKWLASTQFQTHHARRAFPCFDEPKYKAKFNITLIRPKNMKSASNTNILKSILQPNGYYMDIYEETPIMSPYIVVFIVSEFYERSNGMISVMARPDFYPQTDYGFRIGQPILKYLSDYLNNSYFEMGINKMQMAAIPDFSAGAMENWGLVTYRERVLLYEEGSTTLEAKQSIASTIAHEDAHMWFGNLVTCDWWSYTWLNEGFARYFQYFATAEVEKEFQLDQQFVIDQIFTVMEKDATYDTNPLTDPNINKHDHLKRMFNSISYNKGGAFIRMVKFIMGEDNFRSSLQNYLRKYKYQSTIPENLFTIWKEFFPKESVQYADDLFNSFTNQVGYPVITFNLNSNQTMEIRQQRFLLNPNNANESNHHVLYTVPISFTTNNEKNFSDTDTKLYITSKENTTLFKFNNNISWIVANIQSSGYYRVNYDIKTWHKIHNVLLQNQFGGIHEQNRAQIIHDLLNLARADIINYDLAFDILGYLHNETSYVAWAAAFDAFKFLTIRLGTDTDNFGLYIRQLSAKAYNLLGFEQKTNDTSLDIYNRANILAWSCKYGSIDCLNKAKHYFNADLNVQPVPVNIRSVVYCAAMRNGTKRDLEKLIDLYNRENAATTKTLILKTLGCVKERALVNRVFQFVISDAVRSQDKASTINALINENNENVEFVFDLINSDLDKFATAMGGYSSVFTIIENIASRFTDESQKNKFSKFNQDNENKFKSSAERLKLAEKVVANNLLWSFNKLPHIKMYLNKTLSYDINTDNGSSIHLTLSLVTLLSLCFLSTIHTLI